MIRDLYITSTSESKSNPLLLLLESKIASWAGKAVLGFVFTDVFLTSVDGD